MTYHIKLDRFACQITRKDGSKFIACGKDTDCATFVKHRDASAYAKEIRPMASIHAKIKVVRITASYQWNS